MLFLIDRQARIAKEVDAATFADLALKERGDIQEWIIACPNLLGEELLIVTAEFDQFERTAERLDLLAVDRNGKLVVAELKRSAVGTRADLQALRYAAYCSTLTLEDIAELYAGHLRRRGEDEATPEDARLAILDFVRDPDFQEFDDKPRIVLAAEEFPAEITATVLWLRSFEVDVTVVRIRPYEVSSQLVVDSTVLIPLPEAEDFVIRREKKESQQARARGRNEAYRVWFQALIDQLREEHHFTNARVAQAQNWYPFASGISGITYGVTFTLQGLRAEVYIDRGDLEINERIFDGLHRERETIEREFGRELKWEPLEDRRASRVGIYRDTSITSSPEELEEARDWAIRQVLDLKRVFSKRLEGAVGT